MDSVTVLIIAVLLTCSVQGKKNVSSKEQIWGRKYDFVIIGGGTAGSVLAARLSEVEKWKVLVLEAGGVPSPFTKAPVIGPLLQLSEYNWKYRSQPSTNENGTFLGLNDGEMLWSSGKGLGGSSIINYMIYSRGNPTDFDNWNLSDWSYEKVLPYFLKSERANLDYSEFKYHNASGTVSIEDSYYSESTARFIKAGNDLGFKPTDYNGENQLGFSTIQAFLNKGSRETTFSAYFPNGSLQSKVDFVTGAYVTKIALSKNGTKVKSVKFVKDGIKYRARVGKEAILCAGAFNSPKILMLSGLGPRENLDQIGIKVVKDLQGVGRNLIDHVTYPALNFIIANSTVYNTQFEMLAKYVMNLPFWFYSGMGIGRHLGGFEAIAFVNTSQSERPDFELLYQSTMINEGVKKVLNLRDEVYEKMYVKNQTWKRISWSIYPILLHPKSRGEIKLKSKNPQDPPLLYPNYFADSRDLKTMIEAINFVLRLIRTEPFNEIGTTLNPNLVPGCEDKDDEYWECALRTLALTSYDYCGTNKMGELSDGDSVVIADSLLVKGVKNLRVVDASVVPDTISGHLAATVIVVAEKAADFIKHSYISK